MNSTERYQALRETQNATDCSTSGTGDLPSIKGPAKPSYINPEWATLEFILDCMDPYVRYSYETGPRRDGRALTRR